MTTNFPALSATRDPIRICLQWIIALWYVAWLLSPLYAVSWWSCLLMGLPNIVLHLVIIRQNRLDDRLRQCERRMTIPAPVQPN